MYAGICSLLPGSVEYPASGVEFSESDLNSCSSSSANWDIESGGRSWTCRRAPFWGLPFVVKARLVGL